MDTVQALLDIAAMAVAEKKEWTPKIGRMLESLLRKGDSATISAAIRTAGEKSPTGALISDMTRTLAEQPLIKLGGKNRRAFLFAIPIVWLIDRGHPLTGSVAADMSNHGMVETVRQTFMEQGGAEEVLFDPYLYDAVALSNASSADLYRATREVVKGAPAGLDRHQKTMRPDNGAPKAYTRFLVGVAVRPDTIRRDPFIGVQPPTPFMRDKMVSHLMTVATTEGSAQIIDCSVSSPAALAAALRAGLSAGKMMLLKTAVEMAISAEKNGQNSNLTKTAQIMFSQMEATAEIRWKNVSKRQPDAIDFRFMAVSEHGKVAHRATEICAYQWVFSPHEDFNAVLGEGLQMLSWMGVASVRVKNVYPVEWARLGSAKRTLTH